MRSADGYFPEGVQGLFTMTGDVACQAAARFQARGHPVRAVFGGPPGIQVWGLVFDGSPMLWPDPQTVDALIQLGKVPHHQDIADLSTALRTLDGGLQDLHLRLGPPDGSTDTRE